MTELERLLEREAMALSRGAMSEIAQELPQKERLVAELDRRSDEIAAQIASKPRLQKRVAKIRGMVEANGAQIAHLRRVVVEIVEDMRGAQNRHGLSGLYANDGKRSATDVTQMQRVNREV
ncbi:hypothetical protein [Roseivivax sp. THAF40]|uniref:hypothetical protein n=1 Tax=Roseivivax sp. THAF40 TaxID=2587858 RepID=UPI0015625FD9|nr:hypothetical protein [Roseivivax sp. THAF40]